jgi:hypothetical protein
MTAAACPLTLQRFKLHSGMRFLSLLFFLKHHQMLNLSSSIAARRRSDSGRMQSLPTATLVATGVRHPFLLLKILNPATSSIYRVAVAASAANNLNLAAKPAVTTIGT